MRVLEGSKGRCLKEQGAEEDWRRDKTGNIRNVKSARQRKGKDRFEYVG